MTSASLKAWAWLHKWTSLVCTLFMLLLCLTGLPLIFHTEIEHWQGTGVVSPAMPAGTPRVSLDRVLDVARERVPGKAVQFVSREIDDDGFWWVTLGDTPESDQRQINLAIDARTAQVLAAPAPDEGFMHVMYQLHVELFAGLAGKLFLGLMGLLLLVALVSGVVLYAPFMRKMRFGEVRRDRSPRTKWLDLHNLLGIVTLTWALAVGATGMINTWADLLIKYWQYDQLSALMAPYKEQAAPSRWASLQAAVDKAQALEPGMTPGFVAFPGTAYSSPHHFAIMMRGNAPLTARLFKPVLMDAQTGAVTTSVPVPWYVTALLVSQPLHFGDYGGLPMKVLWALLDAVTIIVLGSGLYLWWVRRARRAVNDDGAASLALGSGAVATSRRVLP